MTLDEPDCTFGRAEAAELLDVHVNTVDVMIHDGRLPGAFRDPARRGCPYRIPAADITSALTRGTTLPTGRRSVPAAVIAAEYRRGLGAPEIARRYGVHTKTVYNKLAKAGEPTRSMKEAAVILRTNRGDIAGLAEHLSIDTDHLRNLLVHYGILGHC